MTEGRIIPRTRPVSKRMRQVVDWSASIWAGLIAGAAFFGLNLILVPLLVGGNAWVVIRLFASILLGEKVLAPPATFDAGALAAALVAHFTLSVLFTMGLAFIVHRGGLISGVLGGALFGLALYFVNFYTLTYFFPWFFAMHGWIFVSTHVAFGALAGGIYEGLEVEEFVPLDD